MKLIKLLAVAACAFALVISSSMADEKKAEKKLKGKVVAGSCCDKKIKAGETCDHKCCVEATKEGKVCEKCNPKSPKAEEAAPK
ncbi:MAG: hypothetical protein ABIR24_05030 [Verrucomicrobiota bacterium]